MKRKIHLLLILAFLFCSLAYSKAGPLFNIQESGPSVSADVIICLNGKGPLSCQKYHVSSRNLAISTTINRSYPFVGIQSLTPGYTPTGCTPFPNGYCLFAVNGTTPTTVTLTGNNNTYTIGGVISGLSGSISLQNNGVDTLTQSSNGSFTFPTEMTSGSAYNITVSVQPPGQNCIVSNGMGTVGSTNVTDVQVTCITNYTVGGTVSGLSGTVSLQNNGGDTLTQGSDGSFTFATPVAQGSPYNVTVSSQPATQTCSVINGSGVMGGANVTNVQVTCTTNTYTVGGMITGLSGSVSLQNNGGNTLTRNTNGSFTFSTPVAQGSPYSVTVSSQPATQTCIVTNGSGTMGGANVTTVTVNCTTNSYTVGGTISGLTGAITLLNNGTNALPLNSDGSFTFSTSIAQGSPYNVTVSSQPLNQICSVANGSGTMGGGNVTNVSVTCVSSYSVGGTITGLSGSLILQNNGGDSVAQSTNGAFSFFTRLPSGSTYDATVSLQPSGQLCTVTNGSGTIGSANVTNIQVSCTTAYTVGGTISGLLGSVSLQNNGGDTLIRNFGGNFQFATPVVPGGAYDVTVSSQPSGQVCTVSNGSGTIAGSNITNVAVTCANATTLEFGVSETPPFTLPVGTPLNIQVRNTGSNTALNVLIELPSGWTNVTQNASNCANLPPFQTCTLTFTATTPYLAQGDLPLTGDNISNPLTTSMAFSIQGYRVYDITSPSTAEVVDSTPIPASPIEWGAWGFSMGAGAQSLTDGAGNTTTIVSTLSVGPYAAWLCFSSTNGGASIGEWYLPAICQLQGSGAGCASGDANFYNLYKTGFILQGGDYWSSTESTANPQTDAWAASFTLSSASATPESKMFLKTVYCGRSLTY